MPLPTRNPGALITTVGGVHAAGASFMPNLECEMRVERHVEVPTGEHFSVTYLGKSVAS